MKKIKDFFSVVIPISVCLGGCYGVMKIGDTKGCKSVMQLKDDESPEVFDTIRFNKMSILNPLNKDSILSRFDVEAKIVVKEVPKCILTIYRRPSSVKWATRTYTYKSIATTTEGNKKTIQYKFDKGENMGMDMMFISYKDGKEDYFMLSTDTRDMMIMFYNQ